MLFKYPISDAHIHVSALENVENAINMVDFCGFEHWIHLSLCSIPLRPETLASNLVGALCKLKDPRCLAFGSFHYTRDAKLPDADELLRQIKWLDAAGYDGLKMLDGKPGFRKKLGSRLDDPRYDKMLAWATEQQFPIMYHINDPAEFWHYDQLPEWAVGKNFFYGDGTYPKKLEIDEEAFGFLRKHPNLRVCIPHFFFISDQYGLCCEMLDRYPNLYFDITPGWEMYENFAKDIPLWQHFFKTYAHKILFGSDTYSGHWRDTVTSMQRVLETDDHFVAFEENCIGLNLDEQTLRQIYYRNFYKYAGRLDKKMDLDMLLAYADTVPELAGSSEDRRVVADLVDRLKDELKKAQEAAGQ